MTPDDTQKQISLLREENQRLREQIQQQNEGTLSRGRAFFRKLALSASGLVAGKGLKHSLARLYDELPHNVTKDTMADVSTHLIWRVTRIGVFAISAAVIPILVLMVQTLILGIQNDKLDQQNRLILNQNLRLDQQVQLDESYRRSSFIFLMSNVMDKVDEELKNATDGSRRLSDELIGRIAALSQALLPYRYLENDTLIAAPVSPERGQLLFTLVNSLLDKSTYDKIFEKSNFSYAELKQANFSGAYLRNINLDYAHFPDAVFSEADMEFAKLNYADLSDTHLEEINLQGAQLKSASLRSAELVNVNFSNANLQGLDLRRARISGFFTNCRLDDVQLEEAEIDFAVLDDAHFQSKGWLENLNEDRLKGLFSIRENYQMEPEVVIVGNAKTDTLYRLKLKEDSKLALMGSCERQVLEIVKSAEEVKLLIDRTKNQGAQIIYLTEANPFGSEDLDIEKDSIYLFRITTEDADFLSALMWVAFDPNTGALYEKPLTNAGSVRELAYSRDIWMSLPDYCR